jgi:hypothetical protein
MLVELNVPWNQGPARDLGVLAESKDVISLRVHITYRCSTHILRWGGWDCPPGLPPALYRLRFRSSVIHGDKVTSGMEWADRAKVVML